MSNLFLFAVAVTTAVDTVTGTCNPNSIEIDPSFTEEQYYGVWHMWRIWKDAKTLYDVVLDIYKEGDEFLFTESARATATASCYLAGPFTVIPVENEPDGVYFMPAINVTSRMMEMREDYFVIHVCVNDASGGCEIETFELYYRAGSFPFQEMSEAAKRLLPSCIDPNTVACSITNEPCLPAGFNPEDTTEENDY